MCSDQVSISRYIDRKLAKKDPISAVIKAENKLKAKNRKAYRKSVLRNQKNRALKLGRPLKIRVKY